MTDQAIKTPWHIWVVGLLTLLWNSLGITSYLMTELGKLEALGFPPDQIAYFDAMPGWAIALWALGVWGAFFGSVLILLRSRFAVPALLVSVLGLIGTTVYERVSTTIPAELDNVVLSAAIWILTFGTLIYASRMRRAGVIR
ncbi:MAG: hypothetical protein WAT93_15540 [Pontixanthobacter sp.]